MELTSYLIVFLMAAVASLTQRVSGFGFGIVIMMVLPFIMPHYGEATALSGLLAIFAALIPAIRMFKQVSWKKLLPILITFSVTSFFAVLALKWIDGHIAKKALGGVMILISLYFFFFNGKFHLKPTAAVQISMGTISGAMGGLFAMQGPPAVIYFLGCSDDKLEYMALTQWYFLIGNTLMTFYRAGNGFVTACVLKSWCVGIVGVLIGLYIGSKIFEHINAAVLRRIIYCFMAFSGLVALLS